MWNRLIYAGCGFPCFLEQNFNYHIESNGDFIKLGYQIVRITVHKHFYLSCYECHNIVVSENLYSWTIITAWHLDDNVMYFIIITGSSISYPILFGGVNISYSSYACSNINLRELESNWTEKATSCFTKQNENNTADSHYLKKFANTYLYIHSTEAKHFLI